MREKIIYIYILADINFYCPIIVFHLIVLHYYNLPLNRIAIYDKYQFLFYQINFIYAIYGQEPVYKNTLL